MLGVVLSEPERVPLEIPTVKPIVIPRVVSSFSGGKPAPKKSGK
jgi:hypothetical protein